MTSTSRCQVLDITWHRTSGSTKYELSTSDKYAIWENVQGHGVDDAQRVSLLRVRNFDLDDVARYSCHVTCDYGGGLSRVIRTVTDVCLQEDDVSGCKYSPHPYSKIQPRSHLLKRNVSTVFERLGLRKLNQKLVLVLGLERQLFYLLCGLSGDQELIKRRSSGKSSEVVN